MSPDSSHALAAYQTMAPHYDDFTAHHDYDLWLGNLLPELERLGLRGRALLDVGCGTGKSFLPMLERGWEVTAVDISPAMLARAKRKASGRTRLVVADMRALPQLGSFDLVWCLDDAINYLQSSQELLASLRGLGRNMADGGLCLFDVNTLGAYRSFFAERNVVEVADGQLVWRGQAARNARAGSESVAKLEIRNRAGQVIGEAVHRQRHFPPAEVIAALGRAGLECLAAFGHGYDAVLEAPINEERHSKAVFIAKRSEGR